MLNSKSLSWLVNISDGIYLQNKQRGPGHKSGRRFYQVNN
jgi:hypothetical protein